MNDRQVQTHEAKAGTMASIGKDSEQLCVWVKALHCSKFTIQAWRKPLNKGKRLNSRSGATPIIRQKNIALEVHS